MNLRELLMTRQGEIVARWEERARRMLSSESLSHQALVDSMPAFIEHLVSMLDDPERVTRSEAAWAISRMHGNQRFGLGFDVVEVVRDYDLMRDAILAIAEESGVVLAYHEVLALSRALSAGSAEAVAEFSRHRERQLAEQAAQHLSFLAHELRNPLGAALLAVDTMRRQKAFEDKPLLMTLWRALDRLRQRIDDTLVEARLQSQPQIRPESILIREMVDDIVADVAGQAEVRRIRVKTDVAEGLSFDGDRRLLESAVSNLVRNAVKFSRVDTEIVVRALASHGHVMIEVEDACGGLEPATLDQVFTPFVQSNRDRSGFGLGLAIARQAAQAHRGMVRVHNLPHQGCIFIIELPRT